MLRNWYEFFDDINPEGPPGGDEVIRPLFYQYTVGSLGIELRSPQHRMLIVAADDKALVTVRVGVIERTVFREDQFPVFFLSGDFQEEAIGGVAIG
jgi:hypothetical protein